VRLPGGGAPPSRAAYLMPGERPSDARSAPILHWSWIWRGATDRMLAKRGGVGRRWVSSCPQILGAADCGPPVEHGGTPSGRRRRSVLGGAAGRSWIDAGAPKGYSDRTSSPSVDPTSVLANSTIGSGVTVPGPVPRKQAELSVQFRGGEHDYEHVPGKRTGQRFSL
jgi:hypothetical protein